MNASKSSIFSIVPLLLALAGCRPPLRPPVSPPGPPAPPPSISVLTQHNNSMRTGATLLETQLTPASVAKGMKLLYSCTVNGILNAQLLYVHGAKSKTQNVIYAFTEQNYIYAYDADDPSCRVIWSQQLPTSSSPGFTEAASSAQGSQMAGILSTPVIDDSAGRIYLVYALDNGLFPTQGMGDGSPLYQVQYHLAALDLGSGKVLQDQIISPASVSGPVPFVPARQNQRPGLLLLPNPINKERWIYVAFGGRLLETTFNYHGWVMAFDAKTFAPRGVFCTTPSRQDNDEGGGIWQGGGGLGGDTDGNVYFNTGNGPGIPATGKDHGNSIVKLTPVLQAGKYDFEVHAFSAAENDPDHADDWRLHDIDLGAGGVTLIPDSSGLVSGGKTGVLYLLDRNTMNKIQSFPAFNVDPLNDSDPDRARYLDYGHGPHLHGAWTYWAVSPTLAYVYQWAEKDYLRRFDYNITTGQVSQASMHKGDVLAKAFPVMPGGLISLSANGMSDGVLWVTLPWDDGAGHATGRVMAFDALTLGLLWETSTAPSVLLSHNGPPTVADGKVIVGTANGNFLVYGLANPPATAPAAHALAKPKPRAAAQVSAIAPSEPVLPMVPNPVPWIKEYRRRLTPDRVDALAPPKGNRPLFLATGKGSLTYEARPDAAGALQWVLVEISGDLRDDSGTMPHMAHRGLGMVLASAQPGLAWKETEGGLVHWFVETSVSAPEAPNAAENHDAPWMRFRSEPSAGRSFLNEATYVQLLGTVGGAPPATIGQLGEQVKVPYTGRYVFYVRDSGTQSPPAPPR